MRETTAKNGSLSTTSLTHQEKRGSPVSSAAFVTRETVAAQVLLLAMFERSSHPVKDNSKMATSNTIDGPRFSHDEHCTRDGIARASNWWGSDNSSFFVFLTVAFLSSTCRTYVPGKRFYPQRPSWQPWSQVSSLLLPSFLSRIGFSSPADRRFTSASCVFPLSHVRRRNKTQKIVPCIDIRQPRSEPQHNHQRE